MGNVNGTWTVIIVAVAAFDCLRGMPFPGGAHVPRQGREPPYLESDVGTALRNIHAPTADEQTLLDLMEEEVVDEEAETGKQG
jgi:hypothetical protein